MPYEQFIVPGLVLMGVATSAFANNATSIYQARSDGFIEDPASSPMSAVADAGWATCRAASCAAC